MNIKTTLFLGLFLCVIQITQAQNRIIRGSITDLKTGENLISANAYDANSLKGTTSNYYGFYSLTLPAGKVKLTFSYAGYQSQVVEFDLKKDTVINPQLDPVTLVEEVVITANQKNIARTNQMGLIEMSAKQTKQLPVFMGEADILKTIQLLPGIKGGTEGTSGIYVRGGGPDQNLILLDGVPVYNASHLFGFFSVFNSNAIQSFSVYKGGFPARYGGRLSSVLDIKMKEGNNKKLSGEVSIGLISSQVTIEGPIKNENTSFIVSARRTYFDVFTNMLIKAQDLKTSGGYYFYDINAKINHKFSDRSRIFYSLYNGMDKFYVNYNTGLFSDGSSTTKAGSGWGNFINALRWNYVISDNLFCNSTATFSYYDFFIGMEMEDKEVDDYAKIQYTSGIYDFGAKADFDYIPSTKHYIRFGGNYTYHTFNPGVNTIKVDQGDNSTKIDTSLGAYKVYANEALAYIEDDIEVTDRLKVNVGLHYSVFGVKGTVYNSLQPRISARYMITDALSAKASVVQMKQYVHLLSSSNIGLPTDLWVPATNKTKPMDAWQYAVGLAYNFDDKYEFSVEAYYKPMRQLIEYKEGASFFSINNSWENKIESGKGTAKGIEVLINKTSGKFTGWIGYTLAYSDRTFENISFGNTFPYKYDRRHDVGIALTYKPSEKFDIGTTWVYGSGLPVTLPEEKYLPAKVVSGSFYNNYFDMIKYFQNRNAYRMESYHRLDVSFNFYKYFRWGVRTFSIGAYNAYNRHNPFFLNFEQVEDRKHPDEYGYPGTKTVLKQYSIFPIIPFLKWSLKF